MTIANYKRIVENASSYSYDELLRAYAIMKTLYLHKIITKWGLQRPPFLFKMIFVLSGSSLPEAVQDDPICSFCTYCTNFTSEF
jgi:hypothetical protein